ncbi:hypothetical protein ABGB18_05190 [Nonomuraea sp. B12E4]|uniref:alpha/beta fold hydrolase n=1 Tax=Nonomuraea sp. B12E4 TaxID=3153564 RepID=UPI00325D82C1
MTSPAIGRLPVDGATLHHEVRGSGRSGDAAGEMCHHQDLLAVMDALKVERAALAGSSMGGAYATEAALAAP